MPLVPSLSVWQSEEVTVNSVIPESRFRLGVEMNGEFACHLDSDTIQLGLLR